MGCGAGAAVRKGRELVTESRLAEEARMAPLLMRMEKITDLHREGLMSHVEYEHYRSAVMAEIAGTSAPNISMQKQGRLMRAEERRRRVDQMAREMHSAPDRLPDGYYAFLDSLPPKFTVDVQEQEEWNHAGSDHMQEYYNTAAGREIEAILSEDATTLDSHRNPLGSQYDLPRDGAMREHTLLICWFSPEGTYGMPVNALKAKGFNVIVHVARTSTVQQMMVSLLGADVVWLVSGKVVAERGFEQLLDALEKFHSRGGGIFIWGDNAPFFAHANQLLARLFPGESISLEGNDQGEQIMHARPDGLTPGHLSRGHLIMTGLNTLFEGVTISYLPRVGPLKVIATYNNGSGYVGKPYCAVADAEVYRRCQAPYQIGRGRLVIDGGYTKLYDEFWNKTAGTDRYVKNASAWLLNMHSRIVSEVGSISPGRARQAKASTTQSSTALNSGLKYAVGNGTGSAKLCSAHRRMHCTSCDRFGLP